jgi:hypothetical protein
LVVPPLRRSRLSSGNATIIEWRVLIEEASPDAYEFRALVAEQLAKRGHSGVAVVTQR